MKFKRALFGYNRQQVDNYLDNLKTDENEQKIKELIDENVKLSVELKVARSGYTDAAEMLQSAETRIRDLEQQVQKNQQEYEALCSEIKALQEESKNPTLSKLMEMYKTRLAEMEQYGVTALGGLVEDLNRIVEENTPGEDRFDTIEYRAPEGIHLSAEEEPKDARGVMQRIYQIRSAGEEEAQEDQRDR